MEWIKELTTGFVLLLFGWWLKASNEKRKELDQRMNTLEDTFRKELSMHRAEDTQRFDALRMQFRDDIQRIHEKIETGQANMNEKIDTNQRDVTRRLDAIFNKIT